MPLIWGKREAEYFEGGGWTGGIELIWFEKFVFGRSAISAAMGDHEDDSRYAHPGLWRAKGRWPVSAQTCLSELGR